MQTNYDIKRVNKFNVILILIFTIALSSQSFAANGTQRGLTTLMVTGLASIIAVLTLLFKVPEKIASVVIPMCPAIAGIAFMIIGGGSTKILIILDRKSVV